MLPVAVALQRLKHNRDKIHRAQCKGQRHQVIESLVRRAFDAALGNGIENVSEQPLKRNENEHTNGRGDDEPNLLIDMTDNKPDSDERPYKYRGACNRT